MTSRRHEVSSYLDSNYIDKPSNKQSNHQHTIPNDPIDLACFHHNFKDEMVDTILRDQQQFIFQKLNAFLRGIHFLKDNVHEEEENHSLG